MNALSRKITLQTISENCALATPQVQAGVYDLDSPASSLMVDFRKAQAVTASTSMTTNAALELMKANKIRALMVVDNQSRFAGVVSAMDLMSRKPMAYANEAGIPLTEVQVKNIMEPKSHLKAISRADVERASLGDIVPVLQAVRGQHLLVVEGAGDLAQICGLFSASDFLRALGIKIDFSKVADTFMDLERIINKRKDVI
ncbi:CBS domain-containing protein [Spongiibacter sp. KMU-158]|uniref:CBS domain-containing protein n=1 Tax=Spongiibacter pelagi TaxID=2760804 RepID=A0A927BXR6_9GAMM|nr:CBS domain-containing protein [Spongiibacter pelagi]MBD2857503.1 CBS domain-containing protein [Spongiibacter pelagi]